MSEAKRYRMARRRAWSVYRRDATTIPERPGVRRISTRYLGRVMAVDLEAAENLARRKWRDDFDDPTADGFSISLARRP